MCYSPRTFLCGSLKRVCNALAVRLLALRLPSFGLVFLEISLRLGYGKTGTKNAQLDLQHHCCKTSRIATLRVLQTTNQTCLAINQVVSGCKKVSCRKQRLVLLFTTKPVLDACLTGSSQGVCKTRTAGRGTCGRRMRMKKCG